MRIVVREDNTGYAPATCRFTAIDDDTYDVDCDQDGFFSTSSIGYGATPREAVVDLLEIMLDEGEITEAEYHWIRHGKEAA